jgi:hypothetical protein
MFHRRFVCVTTLLPFGYIPVTFEFLSESNSNEYFKRMRNRPGKEISSNRRLFYDFFYGDPC